MKYYWLKLDKNFFQQHDVRIIESMPNGKEMLLFYIKMLAESVSHEGDLRFSDEVAYDNETLALLTDTDINIVEQAMRLFIKFKLVEIRDDETVTMTQVAGMIGKDDSEKVKHRERQAKYRESHKCVTDASPECHTDVTEVSQSDIEIRDKSIDIKEKREKKFTPPTLTEVETYCKARGNKVNAKAFFDYFNAGHWIDSRGKPVLNWKQKVITWEKFEPKEMPKQIIESHEYDFDEIERVLSG